MTPASEEKRYKYCCNHVYSNPPEFKMQFKIITSVLLFFIAQTMATPNPKSSGDHSCTLPSTVGFCVEGIRKLINVFFRGYYRH